MGEHGEGVAVTKAAVEGSTGSASYTNGQTVPLGFVIEASNYSNLTNKQMNFHRMEQVHCMWLAIPIYSTSQRRRS